MGLQRETCRAGRGQRQNKKPAPERKYAVPQDAIILTLQIAKKSFNLTGRVLSFSTTISTKSFIYRHFSQFQKFGTRRAL
jgi:hypothetical protein